MGFVDGIIIMDSRTLCGHATEDWDLGDFGGPSFPVKEFLPYGHKMRSTVRIHARPVILEEV